MSYSPVPVESFGGLNLLDDPGTVGWSGAIDLLNVDFDQYGRVRSRDGLATVKSGFAGIATAAWAWPVTETAEVVLLAASGAATYKSGSIVSTDLQAPLSVAHLGVGGATYAYYSRSLGTIGRIDSNGTISLPAGMPDARFVAVQPTENRLVAARISSIPNLFRVQFSDPGAPGTWGANNWVDLHPDDGEPIEAMTAWRDLLFVFKRSRYYVFYGNSTDSSGNPIFNYRTVDTGLGAWYAVAAPDGVYFYSNHPRRAGIYRAAGVGPPEYVSRNVEPLFQPSSSTRAPFFSVGASAAPTVNNLCMVGSRVHVGINLGAGSFYGSLLYDPATGTWTLWNSTGAGAIPMFAEGLSTVYATIGTTNLMNLSPTATDDAGTAITSRYRSGFSDLGSQDMKVIREWRLQGIGSPTLSTSTDFGSLETGAAVTLGTSPATAEGRRRYAVRGRQFSFQIGATSAWTLNNLVANIREKRLPGTHNT